MEEVVNNFTAEIATIQTNGFLHNKICLNTDLRIRVIDALFDYYRQFFIYWT